MDADTSDAVTMDAVDTQAEEELLPRPSSWAAALAQLPGFPPEGLAPQLPRPAAGLARAVSSALAEDLAGDEELAGEVEEEPA